MLKHRCVILRSVTVVVNTCIQSELYYKTRHYKSIMFETKLPPNVYCNICIIELFWVFNFKQTKSFNVALMKNINGQCQNISVNLLTTFSVSFYCIGPVINVIHNWPIKCSSFFDCYHRSYTKIIWSRCRIWYYFHTRSVPKMNKVYWLFALVV